MMYFQIEKLNDMCIASISRNIPRLKMTNRESWRLRHCNDIGDRLLKACIRNLPDEELNETTYDFIFNNFSIKKLVVDDTLIRDISYFDILNEKFFDELIIDFKGLFDLRKFNKNFRIYANKFMIKNLNRKNFAYTVFTKCFHIHVYKELDVSFFNGKYPYDFDIEELIIDLLENSSPDIEYVKVPLVNSSKGFIKSYINILSERHQLREIYVNFDKDLPNLSKVFFDLMDESLCNTFTIDPLNKPINWREFNNSMKSFTNIERINFIFENMYTEYRISEVFDFLFSLNLKSLKEIHIVPFDTYDFGVFFSKLVENCTSLMKLEFSCFFHNLLESIEYFYNCSKTISVLNLYFCQIGIRDRFDGFHRFLINSTIRELKFHRVSFFNESFSKIIRFAEVLRYSLTSLTISECKVVGETLYALPSLLKKIKHLKSFKLDYSGLKNGVLNKILNSLKVSRNSLTTIFLSRDIEDEELEDCTTLFEFLCQSTNLTEIYINLNISDNETYNFLKVLKLFQYSLEKIYMDFCCKKRFRVPLIGLFFSCTELTEVYGYPSVESYEKYLMSF